MLKLLLPKQDQFFLLFQKIVDLVVTTSIEFRDMLHDLPNQKAAVDRIALHESEGDSIANDAFAQLHKTFITPFDRNDIHRLTSGLDDVLDQINRCAQRFPFYGLTEVPAEVNRLADLIVESSQALREAIYRLHTLKKADEIFSFCKKISAAESAAHQVVLAGEENLFLHEDDFKQFFKLKDIYARSKLVINNLHDVANIIKGIVLEHS